MRQTTLNEETFANGPLDYFSRELTFFFPWFIKGLGFFRVKKLGSCELGSWEVEQKYGAGEVKNKARFSQ